MMTRFHIVNERRSRGPELTVASWLKSLSLLKEVLLFHSAVIANERLFAGSAAREPLNVTLYSIVSSLPVCAIFLFHAMPKFHTRTCLFLKHFRCHFLSCTLVQVIYTLGRYLFSHFGLDFGTTLGRSS
jgi:hypothetical protein